MEDLIISKEDKPEFGLIIESAVRYALGRRTYITSSVSYFVRKYMPYLSKKDKENILRDIKECKDLGMQCDIDAWNDLKTKLEIDLLKS